MKAAPDCDNPVDVSTFGQLPRSETICGCGRCPQPDRGRCRLAARRQQRVMEDERMTLVEFLRARLDEDERVALATVDVNVRADMKRGGAPPGWVADGSQVRDGGRHEVLRVRHSWAAEVEHIARHDPARVLAEVEAKRRLIEDITADRHRVVEDCWYTCPAATEERDGGVSCRDDDELGDPCLCGRDARVGRRLRLLALPYADHPDYDESWRP